MTTALDCFRQARSILAGAQLRASITARATKSPRRPSRTMRAVAEEPRRTTIDQLIADRRRA